MPRRTHVYNSFITHVLLGGELFLSYFENDLIISIFSAFLCLSISLILMLELLGFPGICVFVLLSERFPQVHLAKLLLRFTCLFSCSDFQKLFFCCCSLNVTFKNNIPFLICNISYFPGDINDLKFFSSSSCIVSAASRSFGLCIREAFLGNLVTFGCLLIIKCSGGWGGTKILIGNSEW